ncbi:Chord-domain-containing protein [Pleurotus pulmonarius]
MPTCSRNGCKKDFEESTGGPCIHHPGAPVFHEGLKSWSCCQDVNKPVTDFDDFLKITGCSTADSHDANILPVEPAKSSPNTSLHMTETLDGKEVYGRRTTQVCLSEDGEGSVCTYHPLPPLFREGSKGYLCCKRKVLEFEEFLKIEGCTKGRHVFAPKVLDVTMEENVSCRIDHYQTVDKVHVSVFAKAVDKDKSNIEFDASQVLIDLYLPHSKRFSRKLDLFGPIDPTLSTYSVLGSKVELHLHKQDTRSWTVLEKPTQSLGNISLTFGVGGRTGTIGGKEVVLDGSNKART